MGPAGRRWPLCGRGNNDIGERSGPHGCSPMAANRTETEELTVRTQELAAVRVAGGSTSGRAMPATAMLGPRWGRCSTACLMFPGCDSLPTARGHAHRRHWWKDA